MKFALTKKCCLNIHIYIYIHIYRERGGRRTDRQVVTAKRFLLLENCMTKLYQKTALCTGSKLKGKYRARLRI